MWSFSDDAWAWLQDSTGPGLFWLNGRTGTGKSAIAHSLALRARTQCPEIFGAVLTFMRGIKERRSLSTVFPAFARQFVSRARLDVRDAMLQGLAMIDAEDWDEYSVEEQISKLVVEPLKSLISVSVRPLLVIIDAVDESQEEANLSRAMLVHRLAACCAELPFLKIFVTSRNENPLLEAFGALPQSRLVHRSLRTSDHDPAEERDIRFYLQHHLKHATAEHIETLVLRAEGLFIHAATVKRFILDEGWDQQARLDMILKLDRDAGLLAPLDHIYLQVLTEASRVEFGDKTAYLELLRAFLATITLARGFLLISDLAFFTDGTITVSQTEIFVKRLASVVFVEDGSVRAYHASFQEFMMDPSRSGGFSVQLQTDEERMARACFRIILDPAQERPTDPKRRHVSLYASQFWASHLAESAALDMLDSLTRRV